MRTARLAKLILGIALISVSRRLHFALESSECYPPPPLKPDSASQANFQALSTQLGDSCSAPILEPERSALLQEAPGRLPITSSQGPAGGGRGLGHECRRSPSSAACGWGAAGDPLRPGCPSGLDQKPMGQTAAVGLIRQGNKTLNVGADGQERVVRVLSAQQAEKAVCASCGRRGSSKTLRGSWPRRASGWGRCGSCSMRPTRLPILGIAAEGDEKIGHQVRIKVKANKYDEPEDDAEPGDPSHSLWAGHGRGRVPHRGEGCSRWHFPLEEETSRVGMKGPQICYLPVGV
jgi:hypothetical protein